MPQFITGDTKIVLVSVNIPTEARCAGIRLWLWVNASNRLMHFSSSTSLKQANVRCGLVFHSKIWCSIFHLPLFWPNEKASVPLLDQNTIQLRIASCLPPPVITFSKRRAFSFSDWISAFRDSLLSWKVSSSRILRQQPDEFQLLLLTFIELLLNPLKFTPGL